MGADTWWDCYEKLTTAYQKPRDPEQSKVYFEALRDLPDTAVRESVAGAIRHGAHWPKPAELRERARGVIAGTPSLSSICLRCHGSGFVDMPDQEHHGITYRNYVGRCPECRPAKQSGERT